MKNTHGPYQSLWQKVLPLLKKAIRKDFVLHTLNVVKAMKELIKAEGGESKILLPAAYLHDVGWSKVKPKLQTSQDKAGKLLALQQHIDFAPQIIQNVLSDLDFEQKNIHKITKIVVSHKFVEPKDKASQMLIDADTLSDTYLDSFLSDIKSYHSTPQKLFKFRSQNTFYTQTAKKVFKQHLENLKKTINF